MGPLTSGYGGGAAHFEELYAWPGNLHPSGITIQEGIRLKVGKKPDTSCAK
jgi:hypothetical protein